MLNMEPKELSAQQWKYSVTKIELLAIVETLKEFKGICGGKTSKSTPITKNSQEMP